MRFMNVVVHCKTYLSADCIRDLSGYMLTKTETKKLKNPYALPSLSYKRLLNDPQLKEKYIDKVKRRYEKQNGSTKWDTLREVLVTPGNAIMLKERRRRRQKNEWVTNEILDMIKRRQKKN